MRLNKYIASAGVCSRRKADELIFSGRVMVDGEIVKNPASDISDNEVVVDGKRIAPQRYIYLMLNKPKGFLTTKNDELGRKTVMELLPKEYQGLSPVGRLDKDSEGLLLMTNDGDFANSITHPKNRIEKIYQVRLDKKLSEKDRLELEKGVYLIDKEKGKPFKVKADKVTVKEDLVTVTIHDGKNREIRRMFAKLGYKVTGLKRVQIGEIKLGNLAPSKYKKIIVTSMKHGVV
jgi:23S rRNA pseudouridine2605 synthase